MQDIPPVLAFGFLFGKNFIIHHNEATIEFWAAILPLAAICAAWIDIVFCLAVLFCYKFHPSTEAVFYWSLAAFAGLMWIYTLNGMKEVVRVWRAEITEKLENIACFTGLWGGGKKLLLDKVMTSGSK